MSNFKSLYCNGFEVFVHQTVLDELCLSDGQKITEDERRKCTELNLLVSITDAAIRRAAGEDVPDMSLLEKLLADIAARK